MTAPPSPAPDDSLVVSYLALRKAIGIIGIALPFALAIGKWLLDGPGLETSISAYYYSVMRDVFVGSLCAIAVFLMSYRGYARVDAIAGRFACAFAIGTALFPTTPDVNATPHDRFIGGMHLTFAALFFLTLAFFSLHLFRKTSATRAPTPRKLQRNLVYTLCGYTIIACLFAIGLVKWLVPDGAPVMRSDPVFWLESIAIVAFGFSWFTKGEAILKDR
jgi:hypothetical protein